MYIKFVHIQWYLSVSQEHYWILLKTEKLRVLWFGVFKSLVVFFPVLLLRFVISFKMLGKFKVVWEF